MANKILILGDSGTGKSTSIEGLDSKETFIIKCVEKDLPFKGSRKKYSKENKNIMTCNKPHTIIDSLQKLDAMSHIKNIVIDDSNYIMTYEYHRKRGEKGFTKFEDIAFDFMDILNEIDSMRKDINVFIFSHTQEDAEGKRAFKTIGKFLDDKVKVEGLFTITLLSTGLDNNYQFITNGVVPSKSPKDMFEDQFIENNLQIVTNKIKEYYEGE